MPALKHDYKLGHKIDRWEVVKERFKKDDGRVYITIRCTLGHERDIRPTDFPEAEKFHCFGCEGTVNRKVKVGDTHDKWLVVSETKGVNGELLWISLCECSNIETLSGNQLLSDEKKCCRECAMKGKRIGNIYHHYFSKIKSNAEARDLPFELTEEMLPELLAKQHSKCALSGVPIWFAIDIPTHESGGSTASIDRINSDIGYIPSNVRFIHKDLNVMKMDFDVDAFIQMCHNVATEHPLPDDVQIGHHMHCGHRPPAPAPFGSGFAALASC